ncbi:hypothetical protein S83_009181 [Arachis hypogaea]
MEILEFKNMVSLPTVQIFVSWFRAALQGMIEKHFGAEIVDELFERFAEKVKEFPDIMDTDRLKLDVLFVLLRRKNKFSGIVFLESMFPCGDDPTLL